MKAALRWLLTVAMVGAGANHFIAPDAYVAMMPAALPWHLALVYLSGVAEIVGGLGLIVPATRRLAAWGLIALLVAVFPANLNMAINHLPLAGRAMPAWALWARLPLQAVFIAWAWWYTRPAVGQSPTGAPSSSSSTTSSSPIDKNGRSATSATP